jgi:hypothetical protein
MDTGQVSVKIAHTYEYDKLWLKRKTGLLGAARLGDEGRSNEAGVGV